VKHYRWNDWNIGHIAEHNVSPFEVEYVIDHAVRPWPEKHMRDRYRVFGIGPDGTYLHVVFIYDPPGVVFVIHARPMTENEKRHFRRRTR
jgi:uncharacterized DUF497 family protein